MNISVFDSSNYLKGLLLLIKKDKKVSREERKLMTHIGKTLGFEKKFIENAISEILDNRYINQTPPVFSTKEIAEKFLKDGLVIAAADSEIHPKEEEWLCSVASRNNIEEEWLFNEKNNILLNERHTDRLEVDNLKVLY